MKFIKCVDGWYIRTDKIDALTVAEINLPKKGFAAIAYIDAERYQMKFFYRKQQAQAWLDNFVTELNTENSNG